MFSNFCKNTKHCRAWYFTYKLLNTIKNETIFDLKSDEQKCIIYDDSSEDLKMHSIRFYCTADWTFWHCRLGVDCKSYAERTNMSFFYLCEVNHDLCVFNLTKQTTNQLYKTKLN
jgi:hypothetical protein